MYGGAPVDGVAYRLKTWTQRKWSPTAASQALRLGSLVWFAWRWTTFSYPLGYGVRVLRYDGQRIDLDVRFAIRPWEPGGKTFASGG